MSLYRFLGNTDCVGILKRGTVYLPPMVTNPGNRMHIQRKRTVDGNFPVEVRKAVCRRVIIGANFVCGSSHAGGFR